MYSHSLAQETNYESMQKVSRGCDVPKDGTQRRTYLDERAIFDANMIEEPRNSVDVLLVFVRYPSQCGSSHANNFRRQVYFP